MKKITYGIRIGIIGSLNSGKEMVFEYLKDKAIRAKKPSAEGDKTSFFEFLVVHENVPIKIRVFSTKGLQQAIMNNDKIESLDVMLFILNLHDYNSLKLFNTTILKELYEYLDFHGISVLLGFQEKFSTRFMINDSDLIKKAKELDSIYCFRIQEKKDLEELFKKILGDFIFKFQYSSPDIFGQAIAYGTSLTSSDIEKEDKIY